MKIVYDSEGRSIGHHTLLTNVTGVLKEKAWPWL